MRHTSEHYTIWPRTIAIGAAALAAVAAAGAVWLHAAGGVSAPEPAKLTGTYALTSLYEIRPGVYLSGASTTIIRWPSFGASARPDGTPRAGQPCSTIYLAPGATTKQVIVAVGSSRLCY